MKRQYRNQFIKRCQGCTIMNICNLPDNKDKISCPCGDCIVKSMCKHECDDYSDYWKLCHPAVEEHL